MERDLYLLICDDIKARESWARKQEMWYRMRGPGIRRVKLPWQGAANLHYPLADGIIDKMKPFYLQQLYANERFADFTGKPGIDETLVQSAAYWFDYKLRYRSNLEQELAYVNDDILVFGRGIIKCTWDVDEKRIRHESVEPIYIIVPENCISLETAERVVHVRHLTHWEYKYGPDSGKYNQNPDFFARLSAVKDAQTQIDAHKQAKKLARGITHTDDKVIIIWEVYEKGENGEWTVHTISPVCPDEDVRDSFKLPYKLYGKSIFVDFPFEDRKGYYETRGVCEILADMQGSMNKMWNEKHDAMTLYNRPVFAADRDVPNTGNIKLAPGQILPFKVAALNMGAPPISFDQEMANTRFVAEQRVAVPDFGVPSQKSEKNNKTATEISAIMQNQNLAVDMRARSYRRSLGHIYCVDWYLLKQHDEDLKYTHNKQSYEAKKEILDAIESIEPSGTADNWDTTKRQQKALMRFQMFNGDPFIKQGPLRENILALDQPGLVDELFQDPMEEQANQAKVQAMEITALEAGLPVMPSNADDPIIHLQVIFQRIIQNFQMGAQMRPDAQAASQQHIAAHLEQLQQKDPKAAKQIAKQFAELAKMMQAAQGAPQQ